MRTTFLLAALMFAWSHSAVHAQPLDRRVIIENRSGSEVVGVFATARNNTGWGPNRLGAWLSTGSELTVNLDDGSGSCNLDVLIVRAQRRHMRAVYDVCATRRIQITASNAAELPVSFVNRTSGLVRYLYVGGADWWSQDLLGPGVSLATDRSLDRTVNSPSGCYFRVRAVYWDESDLVLEHVDLCANEVVEIARRKR